MTKKLRQFISTVLFLALLTNLPVFLPRSCRAAERSSPLNSATLTQLKAHLTKLGITPEEFPVIDCPLGIATDQPAHQVMQIIAGSLYEWREYMFYTAQGEGRLAIEMLRPKISCLSADQARLLLTASRLGTTSTEYSTEETSSRQGVIDSDDRVEVPNPTSSPWNRIVAILSYNKNMGYVGGTGFLIAPYTVLTAGDNLYNFNTGIWNNDFQVTAAQYFDAQEQWIQTPYGTIDNLSDVLNGTFHDTGKAEYDYGALLLPQRFPGIDTFFPLEFDLRPTSVNYAGYPEIVNGNSGQGNMWFMFGTVLGYDGQDDRLLKTSVDLSPGAYGGPLWVYNSTTKSRRVVAIAIPGDPRQPYSLACRLVAANRSFFEKLLQYTPNPSPAPEPEPEPGITYKHFAYVPFLTTFAGCWTGLALTNPGSNSNHIRIEYFAPDGTSLGQALKSLAPHGQTAFPVQITGEHQGWIKVSAESPILGLALVGENNPVCLYDIDLKTNLHTRLRLAHLAADNQWQSLVMLCNPNPEAANVSFRALRGDGSQIAVRNRTIPTNGSLTVDLYTLFGQALGGTMILESPQPIAAFLLYNNRKLPWKAGLSAIPIQ